MVNVLAKLKLAAGRKLAVTSPARKPSNRKFASFPPPRIFAGALIGLWLRDRAFMRFSGERCEISTREIVQNQRRVKNVLLIRDKQAMIFRIGNRL